MLVRLYPKCGCCALRSAIIYTGHCRLNIEKKSGVGMYGLAGGWYRVASMIFPVVVSISTANASERKLS